MGIEVGLNTSKLRSTNRFGAVVVVLALAVAIALVGFARSASAEERRSGSLVMFGGPVHVQAGEVVEGDVVSLGNRVTVDGRVRGNAVSIGSMVEVNGEVDGDVVSVGSTVFLGDNARVGGDVTSIGGSVQRSPGAIVRGSIHSGGIPFRFDFRGVTWPMRWRPWHMSWAYFGFMWILRLVGALVLALVIVAIWPNHVAAVGASVETKLGRAVVIGLVAWLLFVPGMILLAITLIGIPLVPVWILFYVAAAAFGHAAVSVVVGDRVGRLANANMTILVKVLVGALVLAALGLVPGLGAVVAIAVAVIGLGAVLDTRFGTNRPWFPPRQQPVTPPPQPAGQGEPQTTQAAQPAQTARPEEPGQQPAEPAQAEGPGGPTHAEPTEGPGPSDPRKER
ncbi:MAG: hypothetical protein PWR07_481 [Bacillota bacterium]|nr:hypothetical protein [Bacillota bacterium]